MNDTIPPPKKAIPGYVYIIRADSCHYKIGKSIHPDKRVGKFTIQLPFKIEIIHLIPCEDYNASERLLHSLCSEYHVNGEWFLLTDRVLEFFRDSFKGGITNDHVFYFGEEKEFIQAWLADRLEAQP